MRLLPTLLLSSTPILCACGSQPPPTVCEDIGDCSQYASDTWIQSCQTASAALQGQVSDGGCGSQLSTYYACAAANLACAGGSASFPGCETQRAALDGCMEQTSSGTYCAKLAAAKVACPPPDAGSGLSTCNFSNDCQAECYVANVANQCNPAVADVEAAGLCILGCPQ